MHQNNNRQFVANGPKILVDYREKSSGLPDALVDAGFEIVYTGLRKSIEEIIQLAVEAEADVIGLSILSGTHIELCQQMAEEMKKAKLSIPWLVGGNIPDDDVGAIEAIGATGAFPTGTTIKVVINFFDNLAEKKK